MLCVSVCDMCNLNSGLEKSCASDQPDRSGLIVGIET